MTGAYFADGDQHLDYDTYQLHAAPNTTSDFAFKGALRDKATAVWRGMIRVEKDAQRTNAYQENRNLMLSPTTHAVPIPGLEILANDVRCTHGATVGQVDREQLFYLMARGLSRGEAERLIVRGFFTDVLDRIELEPVREALGEALEAPHPAGLGGRRRQGACLPPLRARDRGTRGARVLGLHDRSTGRPTCFSVSARRCSAAVVWGLFVSPKAKYGSRVRQADH